VTQISKWDTPPGDIATAPTAGVARAYPTKPRRSWKPRRSRNPVFGAIAGLIALAAGMGIGRFAFTPVLPMMQADAGVTIAAGAWLASTNYIGYLVGSLSALVWRDQPSTAIRTGLTMIGLSTVGMGFEHDVAAWALLRFVAGVGSALVLIFVFSWSTDRFAHYRHHWLNGGRFRRNRSWNHNFRRALPCFSSGERDLKHRLDFPGSSRVCLRGDCLVRFRQKQLVKGGSRTWQRVMER
jgi:Uncharacterised MFS-type transporter YbfB